MDIFVNNNNNLMGVTANLYIYICKLKEMDVYYTHSFICKVKVISFPSGQHTLISLVLWLKIRSRCPPR